MPFARGFKTRCENIALSNRLALDKLPEGPLPVDLLAQHLSVRLITPDDVPGMSPQSLRSLLEEEVDDWSALTVSGPASTLLIYNPTNSPGRRSNDIAHELAHLLLEHTPSALMFAPDGTWTIRSYDNQQEEEASWLSGCLLLPRKALLNIAKRRLPESQAEEEYCVSRQLFRYRMDVTGVSRQTGRRRST